MRVVASYNIKGGVGKTASVVNLAYLAATTGAKTLVWDLDPQGAATYYFRTKNKVRGGAKNLVSGKSDLDDVIKATEFTRLDVVPADFSYRNLDVDLDGTKKPTQRLARLVRPLAGEYDYVFFDCPPSLSLVSENVFHACDAIVVPTIPTTLSLRSLDQLSEFLAKEGSWPDLAVLPFFTLVDRRKKMHKDMVDSLTRGHTGIMASWIPSASDIERMGEHRAPVPHFAPRSPSTFAYAGLWGELRSRLMGLPQRPDHN